MELIHPTPDTNVAKLLKKIHYKFMFMPFLLNSKFIILVMVCFVNSAGLSFYVAHFITENGDYLKQKYEIVHEKL